MDLAFWHNLASYFVAFNVTFIEKKNYYYAEIPIKEPVFPFEHMLMCSAIFANNDFYEGGDIQSYAGLLKTIK